MNLANNTNAKLSGPPEIKALSGSLWNDASVQFVNIISARDDYEKMKQNEIRKTFSAESGKVPMMATLAHLGLHLTPIDTRLKASSSKSVNTSLLSSYFVLHCYGVNKSARVSLGDSRAADSDQWALTYCKSLQPIEKRYINQTEIDTTVYQ